MAFAVLLLLRSKVEFYHILEKVAEKNALSALISKFNNLKVWGIKAWPDINYHLKIEWI